MTLTKKHFKAIAEILRKNRGFYGQFAEPYKSQFQEIADDLTKQLADYFKTENPAFDREKFRKAVFDGVD